MTPSFKELTEAERQWISGRLADAEAFVARYAPSTPHEPLSLRGLDQAFSLWLSHDVRDSDDVNRVINAVGVAFGSFLVREAGFSWVIAIDDHGSDLAVRALPGTADVVVYPANFVAKRWERRVSDFLEPSFQDICRNTAEVAAWARAWQ